jgi:hypothetical protein
MSLEPNLMDSLESIKRSNLYEIDPILFNETKRILDSKDSYYTKALYDFIKEKSEQTTNTFWRQNIKDTENEALFDHDKKLTEFIQKFWDNYFTYFDSLPFKDSTNVVNSPTSESLP